MEGFLSTSLQMEVALGHLQVQHYKTLIKIHMSGGSKEGVDDFGFAYIKEHSYFKDEEEVLFNPLNTFKVTDCSSRKILGKDIQVVVLEYGAMTKLLKRETEGEELT